MIVVVKNLFVELVLRDKHDAILDKARLPVPTPPGMTDRKLKGWMTRTISDRNWISRVTQEGCKITFETANGIQGQITT
jgi:hypothetical protein